MRVIEKDLPKPCLQNCLMVNSFVPAKAVKQHLKYLKKVKALRAKASSPEELAAAMKKAFPKRGGAENLAEVAANLFK